MIFYLYVLHFIYEQYGKKNYNFLQVIFTFSVTLKKFKFILTIFRIYKLFTSPFPITKSEFLLQKNSMLLENRKHFQALYFIFHNFIFTLGKIKKNRLFYEKIS